MFPRGRLSSLQAYDGHSPGMREPGRQAEPKGRSVRVTADTHLTQVPLLPEITAAANVPEPEAISRTYTAIWAKTTSFSPHLSQRKSVNVRETGYVVRGERAESQWAMAAGRLCTPSLE
jgi:hypothetical protein